MYPLRVRAALPLARTSSRARRVTPGRAEVAHPARRGLGWASCIPPGARAWRGGGRADPPPCVRGRLAWSTRRGGRAVPPLANEGRTRRGAWGWGGVARAEEDWAVRAIPPLACVDVPSVLLRTRAGRSAWDGLAWPARMGEHTVPPLAYAGRARRGAWGWAGVACAEGDWGGPAVLRAPAGRAGATWRGGGGAAKGEGKGPERRTLSARTGRRGQGRGGPLSALTRRTLGREGPGDGGPRANVVAQTRGKGPRAPYLRAKGRQRSMRGTEWGKGKGKGKGKGIGLSSSSFRREWGPELDPYPSLCNSPPASLVHLFLSPSPPSPPPRSCGRGAHDDTGRAGPPQSPSAQATPAQPHAPRLALPAYARGGTATPAHPTRSALPAFARGRMARPRTQGEGWRAQPSPPRRGRHHPNPTRRAASCPHSREEGRRAHPSAWATPAARARKGEGRHVHPLRTGYASGVYAPRHARAPGGMQEAQPSPLRAGCATSALPGVTRRAREDVRARGRAARTRRGYMERGTMQPEPERRAEESREGCVGGAERNPGGGVAHERKGRHIGARVCRERGEGGGARLRARTAGTPRASRST
ncbi:hypothetical protein EDB83DRAFT_2557481 [Lactarius deliciosus]|nr:hypothetical protein EDB83DRAFT_2557481 [Lactarius deliciosus]